MEFNHAAFLSHHFQNPLRLQAVVRLYLPDNVPEDSAARKWFSRGSVPGGWLALLLVVLELDTGRAVSLKPFVRG